MTSRVLAKAHPSCAVNTILLAGILAAGSSLAATNPDIVPGTYRANYAAPPGVTFKSSPFPTLNQTLLHLAVKPVTGVVTIEGVDHDFIGRLNLNGRMDHLYHANAPASQTAMRITDDNRMSVLNYDSVGRMTYVDLYHLPDDGATAEFESTFQVSGNRLFNSPMEHGDALHLLETQNGRIQFTSFSRSGVPLGTREFAATRNSSGESAALSQVGVSRLPFKLHEERVPAPNDRVYIQFRGELDRDSQNMVTRDVLIDMHELFDDPASVDPEFSIAIFGRPYIDPPGSLTNPLQVGADGEGIVLFDFLNHPFQQSTLIHLNRATGTGSAVRIGNFNYGSDPAVSDGRFVWMTGSSLAALGYYTPSVVVWDSETGQTAATQFLFGGGGPAAWLSWGSPEQQTLNFSIRAGNPARSHVDGEWELFIVDDQLEPQPPAGWTLNIAGNPFERDTGRHGFLNNWPRTYFGLDPATGALHLEVLNPLLTTLNSRTPGSGTPIATAPVPGITFTSQPLTVSQDYNITMSEVAGYSSPLVPTGSSMPYTPITSLALTPSTESPGPAPQPGQISSFTLGGSPGGATLNLVTEGWPPNAWLHILERNTPNRTFPVEVTTVEQTDANGVLSWNSPFHREHGATLDKPESAYFFEFLFAQPYEE